MKDYYHILQVDPQAEQEVIEGAYRRLMLKYHPDVARGDGKDSAELLRKVQDINAAYEILSDPIKRKVYDIKREQELKAPRPKPEPAPAGPPPVKKRTPPQPAPKTEIATPPQAAQHPKPKPAEMEKRTLFVRCSTTFRTYKMFIGRVKGWKGPYIILGFEPVETEPVKPQKALSTNKWHDLWWRLRGYPPPANPSEAEKLNTREETLEEYFGEDALSLSDIGWTGHKCPDCGGEIINPIGTISHWSRCGVCHRLMCTGNAKTEMGRMAITCPWCGAKNRIARVVSTGQNVPSPLRGEYATRQKDAPRLAARQPILLEREKKPPK